MKSPAIIRPRGPEGNSSSKRKDSLQSKKLYPYKNTHDHFYHMETELHVK